MLKTLGATPSRRSGDPRRPRRNPRNPRTRHARRRPPQNRTGHETETAKPIARKKKAIVRRVEARGGIKRWCAAEVFELARLRALVARHRAYAFFPPYLACSRARVYGIFDAC